VAPLCPCLSTTGFRVRPAQAAARRALEAIERRARDRTEVGLALDGLPDRSRSEADHRLPSRMKSAISTTMLTATRPKAIQIHPTDQIIISPPFGLRLAPT
jgi:hypothetical protein